MPQQSAFHCSPQSSTLEHRPGGPGRLQLPWSPDWHCLLCLAHATLSVFAAADAAAEVAADNTEHHADEVAALSEYTAVSL